MWSRRWTRHLFLLPQGEDEDEGQFISTLTSILSRRGRGGRNIKLHDYCRRAHAMKAETHESPVTPKLTASDEMSKLIQQYGCGPVQFHGTDNALYERHLFFDNVIELMAAGPRERFEAFARSVRDILSQRWVLSEKTYERINPKRV